MKPKPLYIETSIAGPMDQLWEYTQNPALHQEWDLRFSRITYLPKETAGQPQRFTYETRIGFGLVIRGVGESVATKLKPNGERTSVLSFYADSPLSLIAKGTGYWKYIPQGASIRFLTGYDYEVRWGMAGKLIDRFLFRPLMIRATAWSFDCLKNQIEKEIPPRQAIRASLTAAIATLCLAIIWIYQGLVPKLLYTDTGELALLVKSGMLPGMEKQALTGVGLAEIGFGLLLLFRPGKLVHLLNIGSLLLLGLGAAVSDPAVFALPFNPFSLNLAMIALSVIGLLQLPFMPRASASLTKAPQ